MTGLGTIIKPIILIIAFALSHRSCELVSGPDIISKGFIFMRESTELIEGIKEVVKGVLSNMQENKETDWKKIKKEITNTVGNYLWKNIKREPLIIPIIIDV